jgi:tetratricopeptide (TPR) repeat protein
LSRAITLFWSTRGYLSEGERWLESFLHQVDLETVTEAQVDAMTSLGRITFLQSRFPAAHMHYTQSLQLARQIEYNEGAEWALIGLGTSLWELGDYSQARAVLNQAADSARAVGHLKALASALNNLGLVSMHQGDQKVSLDALNECLALNRQLGNKSAISTALFNLGLSAAQHGEHAHALACYAEAIEIDREIGSRFRIADGLNNMGMIAVAQGDFESAAAQFQEAGQIYREVGAIGDTAYTTAGLGDVAFYRGNYDEAWARYSEAKSLFQEASNQRLFGRVLGQLGRIACRQGDLVAAAKLCSESLTIRRTIGHKPGMIFALDHGFVELALAIGQFVVATRILGAVASARIATNRPRNHVETLQLAPYLAHMRQQLGEALFAAAIVEGEAMSLDEITAYVLDTLSVEAILAHR